MLENNHQIILGRAVVADDWSVLRLDDGDAVESAIVPEGKIIVPLAVWLAQRETLAARAANLEIGVWLAPDERAETLKGELDHFAVIAIDFPKFTDGRGYSTAYNLRQRLGYKGQLRAIGDVLRDQLFSMQRVGFNAFDTRPDRSIHDAVKSLTDFSETYQASIDEALPLYRRHARDVRVEAGDVGFGI